MALVRSFKSKFFLSILSIACSTGVAVSQTVIDPFTRIANPADFSDVAANWGPQITIDPARLDTLDACYAITNGNTGQSILTAAASIADPSRTVAFPNSFSAVYKKGPLFKAKVLFSVDATKLNYVCLNKTQITYVLNGKVHLQFRDALKDKTTVKEYPATLIGSNALSAKTIAAVTSWPLIDPTTITDNAADLKKKTQPATFRGFKLLSTTTKSNKLSLTYFDSKGKAIGSMSYVPVKVNKATMAYNQYGFSGTFKARAALKLTVDKVKYSLSQSSATFAVKVGQAF